MKHIILWLAVGAAALLTPVWLPLVISAQSGPPDTVTCTPPPGVVPHLTNSQLAVDSTGRVFCATRADSDVGEVIFTMDGPTPRVLIPTDPARLYANGDFTLIDGYLYYVSVPADRSIIEAIRIPEWQP